ncbi:MAG: BREX system Lon protease-like protein BrxL [Bacteroidaceae bacterium]|nr:BREX system Lon protease-like protein BrxL [Bacteroidaceae bacterium]
MKEVIKEKVQRHFAQMSIYKDPNSTNSLFAGRNLPSFVKDFLLRRYLNGTEVDRVGLSSFLDTVIPKEATVVKDKLSRGEELTLLTRFVIYIDLVKGVRRFAIPDMGIKLNEGQIPEHIYRQHSGDLVDGEKWGIIKLCLIPDDDGRKNHVEMVDYKPFKPYKSVDMAFLREVRKNFTTEEWIDLILSSIEYEPDSFENMHQKLEFLTRLFIFVEPRLNVIELAPKGTGKSYVFGNLSKYGWLVSGGKVTRAKLFYDKVKQQNGIIKNHDFTVFDEIQTIVFQEPAEIQAALKAYLEQGKTTIDNNEFSSECGLMLMGNIPLTEARLPKSNKYFDNLPQNFRESALLDRFHCFIEGWYLPRINTSMIYKGWTLNIEYLSEVMHTLRTENRYGVLFDQLVEYSTSDMRDFTAIKRISTAAMKLLFPHWSNPDDVNLDEFDNYCLQPAIRRRGIVKIQCHNIDPEFKTQMPSIWIRR